MGRPRYNHPGIDYRVGDWGRFAGREFTFPPQEIAAPVPAPGPSTDGPGGKRGVRDGSFQPNGQGEPWVVG